MEHISSWSVLAVLLGKNMNTIKKNTEIILEVSENRLLRRIFGSKREEVVGGWRRLHNEELHNLYLLR
jgi:hypothetical protein